MSTKRAKANPHIHYHKDGTIWAKGQTSDGEMAGYWEWFRKDGTIMRSGYFDKGEQVGEWTTYDKNGRVVKVTTMKPKNKAAARPVSKRPAGKQARGAGKKQ